MIRTQISLESEQKKMLAILSSARDQSMAELVRQALDCYLKYRGPKAADRAAIARKLAGAWANSKYWKNVDPIEYQRKLRREKGI